jgi:hypothetical protein
MNDGDDDDDNNNNIKENSQLTRKKFSKSPHCYKTRTSFTRNSNKYLQLIKKVRTSCNNVNIHDPN